MFERYVPPPDHIYAAEAGDEPIKIGRTIYPHVRGTALRSLAGSRMRIFTLREVSRPFAFHAEYRAHWNLAPFHVHREYFAVAPDVAQHQVHAAVEFVERYMLTPKQVAAGQRVLNWTNLDLANNAGVGSSPISRLFGHRSRPLGVPDTLAIRAAFEAFGVSFSEDRDMEPRYSAEQAKRLFPIYEEMFRAGYYRPRFRRTPPRPEMLSTPILALEPGELEQYAQNGIPHPGEQGWLVVPYCRPHRLTLAP